MNNGMFELNFHDERYLPFEGAGAISTWLIELDENRNEIPINQIDSIHLILKYTARGCQTGSTRICSHMNYFNRSNL